MKQELKRAVLRMVSDCVMLALMGEWEACNNLGGGSEDIGGGWVDFHAAKGLPVYGMGRMPAFECNAVQIRNQWRDIPVTLVELMEVRKPLYDEFERLAEGMDNLIQDMDGVPAQFARLLELHREIAILEFKNGITDADKPQAVANEA